MNKIHIVQSLVFQCYASRCLQVRSLLSPAQKLTNYCDHLKAANDAYANGNEAEEIVITKERLEHLKLDESDLAILEKVSVDGMLRVYVLPGNNLVVPSLYEKSHENPLEFLHIRNLQCPLRKCLDKRAKVHTLLKKEGPICLHTLLGYTIQDKIKTTGEGSKQISIKLHMKLKRFLLIMAYRQRLYAYSYRNTL